MAENILQLYVDDEQKIKGYPITSAKLVIRENGRSMEDFDKDMTAKHELFEKEAEEKLKDYVDALPSNIKVQREKPENNNVLWLQPEELLEAPQEVTEAMLNRMTEHESRLAEKANKSEIGSPLIAPNIAGMTDKTKVYVNTTDGNWYSWNGTVWTIGGVYNSQGIGDKTITKDKTNFMRKSCQLLDVKNFLYGKKLETVIGTSTPNSMIDNTAYTVSNIIYTPMSQEYVFLTNIPIGAYIHLYKTTSGNLTRYDKAIVVANDSTSNKVTIPALAECIRFDFTHANMGYDVNTNTYTKYPIMCEVGLWGLAEQEKEIYGYFLESGIYREKNSIKERELAPEVIEKLNRATVNSDIPFAYSKICGIGDSIMAGVGEASGGFLKLIKDKYPDTTIVNLGVGSTTIAYNNNVTANVTGKCILDRIDDIPADSDYILLEGGVNDFFHKDTAGISFGTYKDTLDKFPINANYTGAFTNIENLFEYGGTSTFKTLDKSKFCEAFELCLIKIITKFYDKRYGFILVHDSRGTSDINEYYQAMIDICKKYQFPILNLQEVSSMPRIYSVAGGSSGSKFTIDRIHPTVLGYQKRYNPFIENWMKSL